MTFSRNSTAPTTASGSCAVITRRSPFFAEVGVYNCDAGLVGNTFSATLKQPCPVCEANSALWNGANKNLASLRKRKMYYISNVLVVLDQKQPENNGKVFLFKYGVKIMGKIKDAMTPLFGDTEPIDPFDSEAGANFRDRKSVV